MLRYKKILYVFAASFIVIVGSFMAIADNNGSLDKLQMNPLPISGSNGYFKEINVNTRIPKTPEKMMVYKVMDAGLEEEDMERYMDKLGIDAKMRKNDRGYVTVDGTTTFSLDKKTGSFNYYTQELSDAIKPLNTLLTDEEYKKIAENFLNKKGLMKKDAYYRKTLRHVVGKSNGSEEVCLVETVFTRDLNGIRWTGVGPKISVFFGENAEIIGASCIWQEVEKYKEYPIINGEESIKNVRNNKNSIISVEKAAIGNVEEIKLVYNMESVRSNQKYVTPYYLFKGKTESKREFGVLTRGISEKYIDEVNLYDTSIDNTEVKVKQKDKSKLLEQEHGDDDN